MDDTVKFEAFPGVKRAQSDPRKKPASLTDEEWAMLSSGSSGSGAVPARSVSAPQAGATSKMSLPDTHSQADPRFYRRFGFGDFLANAWMIVFLPFMIAALAVRLAASGMFLKFEYFISPWFPADSYGFTADDRLHYASYVVDYLGNLDQSRYLADVYMPDGSAAFTAGEIAHMADVKDLVSLLYFIGVVGLIGSVLAAVHLSRRYGPGMRTALKWGGLVTLILILALGVLGAVGWQSFFTNFHRLFFSDGTWEFYLDDTLIRLFPAQFWVDAGIAAALIMVLVSVVLLLLSRLGHKQRKAAKLARRQSS